MLTKELIQDEIGRFADLDGPLNVTQSGSDFLVRFSQNGDSVELKLDAGGGRAIENRAGKQSRSSSYRGLLSSDGFGNLRRFVEAQRALLKLDAPYLFSESLQLPVWGRLEAADISERLTIDVVGKSDDWLAAGQTQHLRTLVIDGPAGIGKTHTIRSLVLKRIQQFSAGSKPPILHVQSRGRKLTTITDVVAGTLDALRCRITNDQLPVLVRHGLIDIAIDGFDEFADPNGYETAWGYLRDFIDDIYGSGCLLLSGRDTFVDSDQIRRAIPRLDTDQTSTLHLGSLPPQVAANWLLERGVSDNDLSALKSNGLMDEGSYTLRPFFVLQIEQLCRGAGGLSSSDFVEYPLKSLLARMVDREAKILKFVLQNAQEKVIYEKLLEFFIETARDMADGERDWVDDSTAALISDLVFSSIANQDELAMLRHRVTSFALLEPDQQSGRRRFPHSEVLDYFLSHAYINILSNGDIPKSIRRNIIGSDFLENFHDVCSSFDREIIVIFMERMQIFLSQTRADDRSRRNVGSLMIAACPADAEASTIYRISSVDLDEACVRGAPGTFLFFDVTIAQLDCRGADFRNFTFENSRIVSLICDGVTIAPASLPVPNVLSLPENGHKRLNRNPSSIAEWIKRISPIGQNEERNSEALDLLDRLCRVILRQNWIRDIPDDRAGQLFESNYWPKLRDILVSEGLFTVRSKVAVGGPKSDFIRIQNSRELLQPDGDARYEEIRRRVAAIG